CLMPSCKMKSTAKPQAFNPLTIISILIQPETSRELRPHDFRRINHCAFLPDKATSEPVLIPHSCIPSKTVQSWDLLHFQYSIEHIVYPARNH
ncbi:MAG: hypothetical protein IKE24_00725, partial [Clostridia bacterium]|nr:hypothetical protein [Clostridia bacterium]